jgi:hypothetical protein
MLLIRKSDTSVEPTTLCISVGSGIVASAAQIGGVIWPKLTLNSKEALVLD